MRAIKLWNGLDKTLLEPKQKLAMVRGAKAKLLRAQGKRSKLVKALEREEKRLVRHA
jgi:hypothetical protein